jgi:hypothetical protein
MPTNAQRTRMLDAIRHDHEGWSQVKAHKAPSAPTI